METLDFDKERQLICASMGEARRALRVRRHASPSARQPPRHLIPRDLASASQVRFEHATTDRLRTLVTLGCCVGLHYSGHGDAAYLSMEAGLTLTLILTLALL